MQKVTVNRIDEVNASHNSRGTESASAVARWVDKEIAEGHSPLVFVGGGKPVSILVMNPEEGIHLVLRLSGVSLQMDVTEG